jgi:hypothetical protein
MGKSVIYKCHYHRGKFNMQNNVYSEKVFAHLNITFFMYNK